MAYLRRLGIAPAQAEDLIQQTYASFLETFMNKQLPENVDHWLMRALMNRFIDDCRKEAVRKNNASDPTFLATPADSGEPTIFEQVTPDALAAAVERLSPKLRGAYQLHVKGETNDQIGAALGISTGAAAKRLCDARKALRELLAGGLQGDES